MSFFPSWNRAVVRSRLLATTSVTTKFWRAACSRFLFENVFENVPPMAWLLGQVCTLCPRSAQKPAEVAERLAPSACEENTKDTIFQEPQAGQNFHF